MPQKFINSKYPIIEASMANASTLSLALACWAAGIFPSLSPNINLPNNLRNYDLVNEQLKEFVKSTGSSNLIFSLSLYAFFDLKLINMLKSYNVSHVELTIPLYKDNNDYHESSEKIIEQNRESFYNMVRHIYPMKLIWRTTKPHVNRKEFAYCLMGSDAGGRRSELTLSDLFNQQKKLTPAAVLIASGGISTPEQVSEYINRGATAVCIGTLLAASKESPLSLETKNAIVNFKKENIIKFDDTKQNTLILGNNNEVLNDNSDRNRSKTLKDGLYGDGKSGHVYVGNAIDNINSIKTVKEIVEYLVSEL
jgi:NAD(P)H-dependent flavin oxidoreductase YrpB (nitropropane dioxygenase family)